MNALNAPMALDTTSRKRKYKNDMCRDGSMSGVTAPST
jgi:hypothetical protein